MTGDRSLYEKVILDHNKTPRNFGKLDDASGDAEGYNPLCGDQVHVYVKTDGDRIVNVTFEGAGCAISKSSASVMTTELEGKTVDEARALFDRFQKMITSDPGEGFDESGLGKLVIFRGVREYPVRAKCATLAWHTLLSALEGREEPVSTE